MKHLIKLERWLPWSKKETSPPDLRKIVNSELKENNNVVLYAYRFGKQIKSRIIQINVTANDKIAIKQIGSRCQIKRKDEVLDIDQNEFNSYWNFCINKKHKFIYK